MTVKATVLHNPRCSKSRAVLEILDQQKVEVTVVNYQSDPPDKPRMQQLISKLGIKPAELLRAGESKYKELQLKNAQLSDDQLIDVMLANPVLIERPIIEIGDQAVIGRPPGKVLDLLDL